MVSFHQELWQIDPLPPVSNPEQEKALSYKHLGLLQALMTKHSKQSGL